MGHDALIGLPTLASYKLEHGPRFLTAAEQQIEKLINEWIIRRKRKTGENDPGYALQKTALETATRALHYQAAQTIGETSGELQGQHPAKRNAHHRRLLKVMPIKEFGQIVNEVFQAKAPAQGKTIIFAAKLIADDSKMIGQEPGQWS
jgi:hypothetical protein